MIPRITPRDMQFQPLEAKVEDTTVTAEASVDGKEKVTSRVENTHEGHCPICGVQLSPTEANGNVVLFCQTHNIVMPIRD